MLIVFLIDQTRLGDKSKLFSWLVKNSSKVARSRCGQKTANEAGLHCIILDFWAVLVMSQLTQFVVKLELTV